MKPRTVLLCIQMIISLCVASSQEEKLLDHDISQLDSLIQLSEAPTAIFIHTDWCRYCQAMKRQTLKNTQVTDILNDHFNFISFDAEYRSPIEFDGNTYYFRKTGRENGVHELAEAMGTVNGKLDFPIFLVFNKENGLVFRYAGFLRSEDLIVVLNDVNQKED